MDGTVLTQITEHATHALECEDGATDAWSWLSDLLKYFNIQASPQDGIGIQKMLEFVKEFDQKDVQGMVNIVQLFNIQANPQSRYEKMLQFVKGFDQKEVQRMVNIVKLYDMDNSQQLDDGELQMLVTTFESFAGSRKKLDSYSAELLEKFAAMMDINLKTGTTLNDILKACVEHSHFQGFQCLTITQYFAAGKKLTEDRVNTLKESIGLWNRPRGFHTFYMVVQYLPEDPKDGVKILQFFVGIKNEANPGANVYHAMNDMKTVMEKCPKSSKVVQILEHFNKDKSGIFTPAERASCRKQIVTFANNKKKDTLGDSELDEMLGQLQ